MAYVVTLAARKQTTLIAQNPSKPVNVAKMAATNRRDLNELFRAWAEALPPFVMLQVHYAYDPETHARSFHIFYEEAQKARIPKAA
jgi:hypothetical protein